MSNKNLNSVSIPSSAPRPAFLTTITHLAVALGTLAVSASAVDIAVTVRNTTPDNGLWAVNPVLMVHDGMFDTFDSGSAASAELENAAEDGNVGPLQTAFGVSQPNGLSAFIGGPVAPGTSYTQIFSIDPSIPSHQYLSYLSMIIPSNDGFWGNDTPDAYPIFDGDDNVIARTIQIMGTDVWDAGTEVNNEIPANTAFLAQAAPNTGATENGVVAIHPGFMAPGLGGILDATSMAPGFPITFTSADFSESIYRVAEISISVVNDSAATPSRLINISNRSVAGTGDNTQIVGFVVSSGENKQVLIRAVGPGLESQGVSSFLADPSVTVFDSEGDPIGTNDDWDATDIGDAFVSVGAFDLAADSADAAMLLTLSPGLYTAQVGNSSGADGVALVEVYELSN